MDGLNEEIVKRIEKLERKILSLGSNDFTKYMKLHIAVDEENIEECSVFHEVYPFSRFDFTFNNDPKDQKWVTVQLKNPHEDIHLVVKIEVGTFGIYSKGKI